MNQLNHLKKENFDTLIVNPVFFRLAKPEDKSNLDSLLKNTGGILVFDEIIGQVEEYVKSHNPKIVFNKSELTQAAKQYIGNIDYNEYGVWVYYPWSKKLVHLLDETEFIEVRTNRNQYKITPQEKTILATKKIGIIGLSVGQSIALTIAMERGCGELRIADFDILELSNLNRIRAGVHNLGIPKTVVVAREIAEIDPYFKVKIFSDGLTEDNTNAFFEEGGKLDVCIEVCDGLYTKIFSRQKAKELGVPVIMNSSDKGTTDIERYDLDSNYPLLHGLIDHLDLTLVKEAKTNEEKVPYLLPMLGVETSTNRLKASMLEIQETITTWPQLSSGVVLGAGICADVCRRLLLGELKDSGRYFVDLEDLIKDEVIHNFHPNNSTPIHLPKRSDITHYKKTIDEALSEKIISESNDALTLSDLEVQELIKSAITAPSGGNMQPWKWLYKHKSLLLFRDISRTESILNFNNTATNIGLGAACENLILKSHSLNYEVILNKFPLGSNSSLVAVFNFYKGPCNKSISFENHTHDELFEFIDKRATNRLITKKESLKKEHEILLQSLIEKGNPSELKIFSTPLKINELKKIITKVDKVFYTSAPGNSHFANEMRWTKKEAEHTLDGVDINTIDLTPTEQAGFTVSKNWEVTRLLNEWKLGDSFGKLSNKAIDSASALCVLTVPKSNPDEYFELGRIIQRIWLTSTSRGIALQPMSISSFLFNRVANGPQIGIENIYQPLKDLYHDFTKITEIDINREASFIFRLFYSNEPKSKSLRRPLIEVMLYE